MKVDFFNSRKIKNTKFNITDFILVETLLDVRQKNASKLSDNEFRKLISYDPNLSEIIYVNDDSLMNYPESYSRWLLKMFNKGELEDIDPSDVRNYLKSFTKLKNRRTLLPNNDINSYQSIEDLISAINNAKNNLTVNQKNKDAKRNQKQLQGEKQPGMYMNGAVELLFNGKDWEVWTPHTFEGSKALRRGAVWCTGGDTDCYYTSYTKNGTLYVIINKNDNKDKYQLFVPNTHASNSREFKDAQNDTVMFREFVHKNDELLDFFLTREDVTDTYDNLEDPNYDDEWSEEKEDEVMNEYDLTFDYNTFEVCMEIDYNDLLTDSYYTDTRDYRDYATNTFEYLNNFEKLEQLKKDIVQSEYFVRYNNWSETQLYTLYKFFMKETKTSYNDLDFQSFLYVLFKTGGYDFPNSPVTKWFDNRHSYWYEKVLNSITETVAIQLVENFIYDSLTSIGWRPPKL